MGQRCILVFLDGVGLAPESDANPFSYVSMPFLSHALGAKLTSTARRTGPNRLLTPLDACLGVKGLPQSATGQTALLTGLNAAQALGYHLPAFPNERLIEIIRENSILKQAVQAGKQATFANAYSTDYFELVAQGRRTHSVTTHCVLAAGIPFRNYDDLRHGKAVYWDIDRSRIMDQDIDSIDALTAGKHLSRLAADYDFVLYESFLPDLIGHHGESKDRIRTLQLIDGLLEGIVNHLPQNTTIVISSDHGNIEDTRCSGHTTNPVPLLVIGPAASAFADSSSILDVTPKILSVLRG